MAFEVSGAAAGMVTAVDALVPRGRLVLVAIHSQPREVNLHRFFWRELTLLGARLYARTIWKRRSELITGGGIPAASLISRIEPLERVGDAFAALESGAGVMKVLLDCGGPRVSRIFDLSGRLAVVTGARRGIGLAVADALAAAGADIVAVSARLETQGSEVVRRVQEHGRHCEVHAVDFADRTAVAAFAAELNAGSRPVDILVNNAGTIARAPAAEHSDADWDHVLAVNLTSQFILTRELGRKMLARGRGKIIFTASLLSFQGGVTVPGYAASKSGVAGLTRALANEWAGRGVNVNAIVPGYIATDNTQALRDDAARDAAILGRIPAGRWGCPKTSAVPRCFSPPRRPTTFTAL